jgi:hypothetical protein
MIGAVLTRLSWGYSRMATTSLQTCHSESQTKNPRIFELAPVINKRNPKSPKLDLAATRAFAAKHLPGAEGFRSC